MHLFDPLPEPIQSFPDIAGFSYPSSNLQAKRYLVYFFILQNKDTFLIDINYTKEQYYDLLTRVWNQFTSEEINCPEYCNKTLLLHTLNYTHDENNILFAIGKTSYAGINLICGNSLALLRVIDLQLDECTRTLIRASTLENLHRAQNHLKGLPKDYPDFKKTLYRSLIEETILAQTFRGDPKKKPSPLKPPSRTGSTSSQ